MKFLKVLMCAMLFFLGLSCSKKDNLTALTLESTSGTGVFTANSVLSAEVFLNELEFIVRQVMLEQSSSSFLNCANITRKVTDTGEEVTIEFSPSQTCSDETVRSGKLLLTYQKSSGNIFIRPDNYRIGETKISGNYTIQPGAYQQKPMLTLVVPDGKFTYPNGSTSFSAERITMIKDGTLSPYDLSDDIIETTSATYNLSLNYPEQSDLVKAESTVPYLQFYSCADRFRPRSGKIKLELASGPVHYIRLGSGKCEDDAVIAETP